MGREGLLGSNPWNVTSKQAPVFICGMLEGLVVYRFHFLFPTGGPLAHLWRAWARQCSAAVGAALNAFWVLALLTLSATFLLPAPLSMQACWPVAIAIHQSLHNTAGNKIKKTSL